MRLETARRHPIPVPVKARRKVHQAGTASSVQDSFDDRVTENIFDAEDEYAAVGIIVRGINSDAY